MSNGIFETDAFKDYKAELLSIQLPNTSDAEENPNYTIGEIFSADTTGVDSDEFAQLDYLNSVNSDAIVRDRLVSELRAQGSNIMPSDLTALSSRLNREKYQNLINYVQEYAVQTVSPESPPQRLPRQTQDFGLLGEQRMARRDPIVPRDLTTEEKLAASRGADITSTYYLERGDSIGERYGEFVTGVFDLSPESHSAVNSIFSLTNPTKEQVYELIKNEDPEAEVFYVDPTDKTKGLLVRSEATNGKLVPWRATLGSGLFTSADTTFRPLSENISGPFFTNTVEEIARNLSPELIGGGVATFGLRQLLKKGSAKLDNAVEKKGEQAVLDALKNETEKGQIIKGAGKYTALGAAVGIPTAMTRYLMLTYGKAKGVHPNLDAETMLEDAGLIGMMAGLGVVGGDLALRAVQNITRKATGNDIPDDIIARIRARVAQMRAEDKASPEVLGEMSKKEVDDILKPYAKELGRAYSETKTLGDLSGDEVLQAMESYLLSITTDSDPARIAVRQMLLDRGSVLQNFYEEMRNASGKNAGVLPSYDDFKAHYAKLVREAKEADIAAQKEVIKEGSAISVLEADSPTAEITETVAEQVPTSTIFPDKRASLLVQRDSEFNEAKEQLAEVLDSEEVISIETKQLDKFIGPTIKRFISGGSNAPIKSVDEAEAAAMLRDLMPMKDGQSIIKNLIEGQQRSEAGTFLAKPSFTLQDIVNARINIQSLSRSPNRALKNYADELKNKFDDAIEAMLVNKPELRERLSNSLKNIAEVQENVIDGAYLRNLVISEDYPQMVNALYGGTPKDVRKLFDMMDIEDLKNGNPGYRTEQVRAAVLQELRKEVLDPELSVSAQNKKFRQILKDREEQLQEIFPEQSIKNFRNFENFSRQAELNITDAEKRVVQLTRELRDNLNEEPFEIISKFLDADPRTLAETGALDEMRKLSAMADEYPELRNSMRAIFTNNLRQRIEAANYGRAGFDDGVVMLEKTALKLDVLENFIEGVGGGEFGTKQLSDTFGLVLGKEMGQTYARNLRVLAEELKRTKNRVSRQGLLQDASRVRPEEVAQGFLKTLMRFFIPPLTQTGRRANLVLSKLGGQTQERIFEILTDPEKTQRIIDLRNRELTQRQAIELIGLIAASPYLSQTLGENQDAYTKITGQIKDADEEAVRRIIKPLTTSMRDGGSVNSALAKAEARNAELRRSRG